MSQTQLTLEAGIATVWLDRADVHNAFNAQLIDELIAHLSELADHPQVRVLVLAAHGPSFSAGADLNWMRAMATASEAANYADALKLAELMRRLAYFPTPTIARVQGSAFGGGVGLIACCDIAIGVPDARFGLTESKLGLAPAVISPYVIEAIGPRAARKLFLTAELFDAATAAQLGLLHRVVAADALDAAVVRELKLLSKAGPHAVRACKQLVQRVSDRSEEAQLKLDEANARLIAGLRVSAEGQEGLSAFLDKRDAAWIHSPRIH
jgi:methylglutaconyl-CoA hydratase